VRNLRYALLGVILLLIGCNIQDLDFTNIEVENLQSEIAVPFGTASYTMRELIEDISDAELELVEDPVTAELMLIYRDTASYTFTSDIFDVPNNSENSILSQNDAVGPLSFSQSIPFTQPYVSQDGEIIDSVFHETNASVNIQLTTTTPFDINYTLELSNTTNVNTDAPMTFVGTISAGTSSPTPQFLTDHKTVLTEIGGENVADFVLNITANLAGGESFNSDQISVNIEFLDQDFIVAFGKLGQDTVAISEETIDIAFFDDIGVDGLEFGSPEITFDFRSSFGIPIGVGFGGLYGEESDGTRTYLGGSVVSAPPVIASASLENPVTGAPVQSIISLNSSNSTLRDLLATSPSTLGFDIQGFTNPYDQSILNFVTDTSSIRSYIEMTMPMEVRLTDVTHNLDFDLGGGVDFSQADSLSLRVITVNELPFSATMDMYIVTAAEDTLYTVLENQALDIPFLNFDRTVREPKTSIEDIPFGKTGIDALNNGDKIRIVIRMNSPESQTAEDIFVKLLATAKLEISLAARGIIDVKL